MPTGGVLVLTEWQALPGHPGRWQIGFDCSCRGVALAGGRLCIQDLAVEIVCFDCGCGYAWCT
jgi:hypothetical protein